MTPPASCCPARRACGGTDNRGETAPAPCSRAWTDAPTRSAVVCPAVVRDAMSRVGRLAGVDAAAAQLFELRGERVELFFGGVLEIGEYITGRARTYELVQLQMNRLRVTVLRRLNQEDHQEG